ncbi:MAG: AraC family transcriptional regulator [Amaricoccus sp.]|uniref:helix-turn-helix transcriptional regulator n=1 Tax=Amaricoccus sp. TaxID=1872485 RepID=UPI0039E21810
MTFALILLTPQPDREVALGADRWTIGLAPIGGVEIVPAGADLFARWRTEKENMLFALGAEQLAELADGEFGDDEVTLRPPGIGFIDRGALCLAQMARDEIGRGEEANTLCLDSLIVLLGTHLLRSYSTFAGRSPRRHVGGLAPLRWRFIRDYIESHLSERRLSIRELATTVGLSPSHFLRAFRETAGQAPHSYVIERRLVLAERLIREGDLPLNVIASMAGFASNSHMTSSMRRVRGYTPKDLRSDGMRRLI